MQEIEKQLYPGIGSKEVYEVAFSLLKKVRPVYASKYKLKKAIYELGPSGFPFEKFVAKILEAETYSTQLNQVIQGKCIKHEVDLIAWKNGEKYLVECKFHSEEGRNCDVKVPLYIHSRFGDIIKKDPDFDLRRSFLVTNTRFTRDALDYANCVKLDLISWNYPPSRSLKELIDNHQIYPLTVSTLLSGVEKDSLLRNGIVLVKEVLDNELLLDKLQIKDPRRSRVLAEFQQLCNQEQDHES